MLENVFVVDCIVQVFIMIGIWGIGKIIIVCIIVKGLNCIGFDGVGGFMIEFCGVCEYCVVISEGCYVDVMEMDVVFCIGVNDICEIIELVYYCVVLVCYKIYIIDEVYMLLISVFNVFLKMLEELLLYVKFIFVIMEICKVLVMVFLCCQCFDLCWIEFEVMIVLLCKIVDCEGVQIIDDVLVLVICVVEGLVCDVISLLDQVISYGVGEIIVLQVCVMLGLVDWGWVLDLFDMILCGDVVQVLVELQV